MKPGRAVRFAACATVVVVAHATALLDWPLRWQVDEPALRRSPLWIDLATGPAARPADTDDFSTAPARTSPPPPPARQTGQPIGTQAPPGSQLAAPPLLDASAASASAEPSSSAPAVQAVPPVPPSAITEPEPPASAAEPDRPRISDALLARYRIPSELTRRPQPRSDVDLDLVLRNGTVARGGRMRMLLLISDTGLVDQIVIESSTLEDPLRSRALARFYGARFAPGEIDGKPVPSRVLVEVVDNEAEMGAAVGR